jgi:peptidoglycan/xylan/chitin deacetylase (PgdA/CDA1 family)
MRPVILMYHSVTDSEPIDPYGVSRKAFCDQISWLLDQDYQFMSLATLVQSGRDGLFTGRRKQVVVTFDDGYRDLLANALPILLRHRVPATLFLVTDMLGQSASWNRYCPKALLMTEEEVRQVRAQGMSLGSHTLTHVDLTALGDEELRRQLVTSQIALADLGETFFSFSYPWGKHTDREVAALKAASYQCAVAVGGTASFSRADPYRLGRLMMHRDLSLDSFRRMIVGSGLAQRMLVRAQTRVRRLQKRVFPGK